MNDFRDGRIDENSFGDGESLMDSPPPSGSIFAANPDFMADFEINYGIPTSLKEVSDVGVVVLSAYTGVKFAVATVLGWRYADMLAEHAINFHEYNEAVYPLLAGAASIVSGATFWTLMATLGVRAVANKKSA